MTTLQLLPRDAPVVWRMCEPVPLYPPAAPRALAARAEGSAGPSLDALRSALATIPDAAVAALGYDGWRNIVFAIHEGTDGSEEGRALAHEFSARDPERYNPGALDAQVWDRAGPREGGITVRTVLAMAREHGWSDPSVADEFAVVVVPDSGAGVPGLGTPLPVFERDKSGRALATPENLLLALGRPDVCGWRIAHDTFTDTLMRAAPDREDWQRFTDEDYFTLHVRLTSLKTLEALRFHVVARDKMLRDAVASVAKTQQFDSAQLWLNGLSWDGVHRVRDYYLRHYGVTDAADYARAVACYQFTAMAGRVLDPGCKADMAIVMVGAQGTAKTSGIEALVPHSDHYVLLNLAARNTDLSRALRGKLIGELGELSGLLKGRDAEDIKAWITTREEEWTPKYKEMPVKFARRLVLVGTTNSPEFLSDATGNRRWLPITVGPVADAREAVARREAIEQERDQLWAEARVMFRAGGVAWQDAMRLAPAAHDDYRITDSWEGIVGAWLNAPDITDGGPRPRDRKFLQVGDVAREALNMQPVQMGRREEMRIGKVLRVLGYERRQFSADGRRVWAYAPEVGAG